MPKEDLLLKYMQLPNIAPELEDEELSTISNRVVTGYQADEVSRSDWLHDVNEAIDLAKLKRKAKNTPWPNASNVKFPLITTAALQFNSRMYPEIVRNGRVVMCQVLGKDPQGLKAERARRVSSFMSYQLLTETDEWEQGTDSLLHILPVVGTAFRKTYYKPIQGRICSEICLPDSVVVNNDITSIETAQRITHTFNMSTNEIVELMRAGVFSEIDLDILEGYKESETNENHKIYEQHCYLDLDEDGYKEPYIVTIHAPSQKVLRINARFNPEDIARNDDGEIIRIEPLHYFTDYHFIRSPDGGFYSLGFGTLLLPLNSTMNTILNQLIDSASLASLQGGFIGSGLKSRGGDMTLRPGEWKPLDSLGVDISRNIVPINYKEPSPVLFQLLGFLIEHTNRLTSITDALSGTEKGQNTPATTMTALVEQGLKVFNSIMRRQYWSFKKEFSKIYRLNSIYVSPEEYQTFLDEPIETRQDAYGNAVIADFEDQSLDIKPVSDPNISSDVQRIAKIKYVMSLKESPNLGPLLNSKALLLMALEAADIPNIDVLMGAPEPTAPDPHLMQTQIDGTMKEAELHIKEQELTMAAAKQAKDMELIDAQIQELSARSMKEMREADASSTFQALKLELESLKEENKHALQEKKGQIDLEKERIKAKAKAQQPIEEDTGNAETGDSSVAGSSSDSAVS